MTSDTLFLILLLNIAIVTVLLSVFFVKKIKSSREKIKILDEVKKQTEESIEKSGAELTPIFASFYGDESEPYLKTIKKQNLLFCNHIIALMMEYSPDMAKTLPNVMELLSNAYINAFYEASQSYQTLTHKPHENGAHQPIHPEFREFINTMSGVSNQHINEEIFHDSAATNKYLVDLKEKIETVFLENQEKTEELSQYMDLIEQLRQEKKDLRDSVGRMQTLVEQIYDKYQHELKLPEKISFKNIKHDVLISAFKLDKFSSL
ncbi:MAG: hypothetical protein P4L79_02770 [Legionella sp.]|uniref:hypothetical protein n=1 Tax=Legionella sp. TaxID=459 RepID=UPI002845C1CE|nr:hypothetical protein [Legionella sp.]